MAKAICRLAKTNPWQITRPVYSEKDLDLVFGHPAPGRYLPSIREKLTRIQPVGKLGKNGREVNCYFDAVLGDRNFAPTANAANAVFLMRAAKLLGEKEFASVAQSQADVIAKEKFDSRQEEMTMDQFLEKEGAVKLYESLGFDFLEYDQMVKEITQ